MVTQESSFDISIIKIQIIVVLGLVLFGYGAFASFSASPIWVPCIFSFFFVLSGYLLLFYGHIHIDNKSIRHYTIMGNYEMFWDDINEILSSQGIIVLVGENKQLTITDLEHWSGSNKAEAIEFYWNQIEKRNIQVHQSAKALFKGSNNTNVD
jgi:hypothetical protein